METMLQEIKWMAIHCSRTYFENTNKTRNLMRQALTPALKTAHDRQLIFDSKELSKNDIYCLTEINRQQFEEHYGQHHRFLLNALLITTYSTLEHTLANITRIIYRNLQKNPPKEIYVKDSLSALDKINIQIDKKLATQTNTLRLVRNILVHARGEWIHQKPKDLNTIFDSTPHVTRGNFGVLEIAEEYLEESLILADKLVIDIITKIDERIENLTSSPEPQHS